VDRCGGARQVTGGGIMRGTRFACYITKATDTHAEHVILLYHGKGFSKASQCCVKRTVPVLLPRTKLR
jgi:hypothetical protein